jgi:hypothetical protein
MHATGYVAVDTDKPFHRSELCSMRHLWSVRQCLIVLGLLVGGFASACSTPVFRYALERWPPDTYVLEARLPAQVPADLKAALAELQGRQDVNVAVRELPADGKAATFTLRFPHAPPEFPAVVSLPATKANLALITDSPARAEAAKHLLAGETAVFLFLESGNAEKDKTVLARLQRIIGDLQKNLELPPQAPADTIAEGDATPQDLKVAFSIVRVKRDDPKEKVLVETLLASEPDLHELKGPMAFPVFGRGRALYAIVDKGINAEVLYEAGAFMTGACSCQVKAQNPGVDLPMTADWDSIFKDAVYQEVALPPLTSISVGDGEPKAEEQATANEEPMAPSVDVPPVVPEKGVAESEARTKSIVAPGALLLALPLIVIIGSVILATRRRSA